MDSKQLDEVSLYARLRFYERNKRLENPSFYHHFTLCVITHEHLQGFKLKVSISPADSLESNGTHCFLWCPQIEESYADESGANNRRPRRLSRPLADEQGICMKIERKESLKVSITVLRLEYHHRSDLRRHNNNNNRVSVS